MTDLTTETIGQRLEAVRERMETACTKSGRSPSSVDIVAVTKTYGPKAVREAIDAGLTLIGENRVQEAIQKQHFCPAGLHWHLVGHLQTNKARHAVRTFEMIHSIDSLRVLEAVERAADLEGITMPVCLEVNVSGEGSKWGLKPEDVLPVLEAATSMMRVDIVGLMTIPPFSVDPEHARPFFAQLRELRNDLREASGFSLDVLSMGMSNDFDRAIEEGATLIRLGTVLFGTRTGGRWKPEMEEQ
ncbi:MAG: YggS family pyridoxal phosphate-dependent enzyme [Kiritimatiellae bacterium]|nr:YggS family pyridoxal phosphate-dependent enzyme [Kiritimatiellia bacterium]